MQIIRGKLVIPSSFCLLGKAALQLAFVGSETGRRGGDEQEFLLTYLCSPNPLRVAPLQHI